MLSTPHGMPSFNRIGIVADVLMRCGIDAYSQLAEDRGKVWMPKPHPTLKRPIGATCCSRAVHVNRAIKSQIREDEV